MPLRHHRCVFLFEVFNKSFVLAAAHVIEPLSTSKPVLSYILRPIEKRSYERLKCLIDGDVRFLFFVLQLFLLFSVGTSPSAGMEMDIIVENSCTVKEVRKNTLHVLIL